MEGAKGRAAPAYGRAVSPHQAKKRTNRDAVHRPSKESAPRAGRTILRTPAEARNCLPGSPVPETEETQRQRTSVPSGHEVRPVSRSGQARGMEPPVGQLDI